MKTGSYKVSFDVNLNGCEDSEEAHRAVALLIQEMLDEDNFPVLKFELLEEFDLEYEVEEDELKELDF